MRAIARDGYGWTEFIDHTAGTDREGCSRFFRRAGAWLALFHGFAATDMHQENMIAAGDHPVPIDLEMILQATADERKAQDPEGQAFDAATEIIANSVLTVGLLPAYGRTPDNKIFAVGAMTADQNAKNKAALDQHKLRRDAAGKIEGGEQDQSEPPACRRPVTENSATISAISSPALRSMPNSCGARRRARGRAGCSTALPEIPIRKVLRPTQFYYLLLQRLKDHRAMEDGAIWSAQADFIARLVDWDKDSNPLWPLQRRERAALLALNVPHFVSPSDKTSIEDASGFAVRTQAIPGLDRARARVESLDDTDIAWQIDVIRHSTSALSRSEATTAAAARVE